MITHQPPHNHTSEHDREPLSSYLARVSSVYPNIPLNILENWAWCHWDSFNEAYGNYNLANCSIKLESWSYDRIMKIDALFNEDIAQWGDLLRNNSYIKQTWLAMSMDFNRTWPAPIIVFDNLLLEGHRRLGFLKSMIEHKQPVKKYHDVWVYTRNPQE